jgi:hypothetical protein
MTNRISLDVNPSAKEGETPVKTLSRKLFVALLALAVPLIATAQSVIPHYPAVSGGRFLASSYANWSVKSTNAVASGSQSITLDNCYPAIGSDNRQAVFTSLFNTDVKLTIIDGSLTESVTPTAITTPTQAGPSTVNPFNCAFTATFANAHGVGVRIVSGDQGLMEAVNDASAAGSSVVTVDQSSGVNAATLSGVVFGPAAGANVIPGNMTVEYLKGDAPLRWTVTPARSIGKSKIQSRLLNKNHWPSTLSQGGSPWL